MTFLKTLIVHVSGTMTIVEKTTGFDTTGKNFETKKETELKGIDLTFNLVDEKGPKETELKPE